MKATGLTLLLAVALLSHVVFAQEQTPPRFMLEVSQSGRPQPFYMPVPEHGESRAHLFARSLFAPRQSSFDESRASALRLVFRLEQDTVKLTASAYFGRFDTNNTPQSLEGLRQEPVGSFSLRLGDSAALREADSFGFVPVTIKVVSATADQSFHPQVVSKVPSLQVDLVSQTRAGYEVAVRNTSSRAVIGYSVGSSLTDENTWNTTLSSIYGAATVLIAPGAVRQETVYCPPTMKTQACDFVLRSVLFQDGTYEGEPQHAADMEARRAAESAQQRRLQELIVSTVEDATLDDPAKLAHLREQLRALPDSPDKATSEAILKQVQSRFPVQPPTCTESILPNSISIEFHRGKQLALRSLDNYEEYVQSRKPRPQKVPVIPLSEWLAKFMNTATDDGQ